MDEPTSQPCCCSDASADGNGALPRLATGGASADMQKRFGAFMSSVNADAAIPSRTKELMAIAMSVLSKCEPCVKIHIEEARKLGITEDEITEAIWMAISFGGAPTMMFYRTLCEKGG